jgi:hypothetical protein
MALQQENLFPLAYQKAMQLKEKAARLAGREVKRVVLLIGPPNLACASDVIDGQRFEKMDTEVFMGLLTDEGDFLKSFEDTVVILTNNVLARIHPQRFAAIAAKTPFTRYAIHDYDNHHWHEMSLQCGLLADAYFPAHLSDFGVLSRVGANIIPGVPCGSIQWTKPFLEEKMATMFDSPREPGPLGMHNFYSKFTYRNQVIQTLSERFPKVWFSTDRDFHKLTQEEKWQEWVQYEYHLIVPVNNDLPIRFFDALISGGIPMIPKSLTLQTDFLGIPRGWYATYGADYVLGSVDVRDCKESSLPPVKEFTKPAFELLKRFHIDGSLARIRGAFSEAGLS